MAFHTLRDGEQLYYEVHGDGPPLLLVSGLGGICGFWAAHLERFARTRKVILHDQRGTGRSSPSEIDYSVEQMADDLVQLMDGLEIERADFIGHSTGGAIGQVMALDHAPRLGKLVLSATWAGRDAYFELLFSDRKRILNEMGAAEYLRSLLMVAYPPAWIRDHHEAIANPDPQDVRTRVPTLHCGTSRIDAIRKFDRRAQMGGIKAETLVICARDDTVTPVYLSEELAAGIPGAKAFYLSDGGHFYTTSRPKTFQREAVAFLDGRGGAALPGVLA